MKIFGKYLAIIIGIISLSASPLIAQDQLNIVDKTVNFGFRPSGNRTIDAVIVHSTFNNSGGEKYDIDLVIKQFSRYGVSSHYVIGREGKIYKLVDEKNVSYHAGKSQLPDGRTSVNTCSIGIELMTSFEESPSKEQIEALTLLVKNIQNRYKIKYILRHSDIAPGRKTDPWNMDWEGFQDKLKSPEN